MQEKDEQGEQSETPKNQQRGGQQRESFLFLPIQIPERWLTQDQLTCESRGKNKEQEHGNWNDRRICPANILGA